MKQEIYIIIWSITLVFIAGFIIFNTSNSSGFAVYESQESGKEQINTTTKVQAIEAINESESIILEMQENNFSTAYMSDALIEARRVFMQAEYAEILGSKEASEAEKIEARKTLSLINWKNINYGNVIVYAEDIKSRRVKAFQIYDSLAVIKINLEKYSRRGTEIPEAEELLNRASAAFYEDRYKESEELIEEARNVIQTESSEASIITDLRRNSISFILEYWLYILIFLIAILSIAHILYKKISFYLLKNRIKKAEVEKRILLELIKKAQEERFEKNTLSSIVYNIKMKRYHELLQKIEQELPVLESKLAARNKLFLR